MRLVLFTVLSGFLILNSCDSPQSSSNNETPEGPQLYSFEIASVNQTLEGCTGRCTQVSLNYPVFNEGPKVHDQFNQVIESKLKATISNYLLDEVSANKPLDEYVNTFFEGYKKFKSQFPESITPWELQIDIVVSYIRQPFMSLAITTSSYTGGAHTNQDVTYLNLSESGKELNQIETFIGDVPRLSQIAEKIFREKYNLSASENLSEAGFMFDNDQFDLTDNFGFINSGIVFYYNSYEIASYSEGPTALVIPFEMISEILK